MSQQILPFYLLCDESGSMSGAPLDAINDAMPELHAAIGASPVVADKTRFCLIGFADHAEVLLPLADLSDVTAIPSLNPAGQTSYGRAFELLRETIENDVRDLKSEGHQVYRPAVFFLSDGLPTDDDWRKAYLLLTDATWTARPNILAFGFGDADMNTISEVATVRAFIADGSRSVAEALREFANSLIRSIVNSGMQSAADPSGGATLSLPDQVPGFTSIPSPPV
jgi:uncharacterized protein YegL